MSRLEVANLSKTLSSDGGTAVLRGVSFRVNAGACVGIQGVTGSGKTTLLRIIAGLERPDHGEVHLDDALVSSPKMNVPPGDRRIGFVFQHLGLWPHLNVESHLDYVLSAAPLDRKQRVIRKAETIQLCHLQDLLTRRPAQLSGGERHLLAIARALVGEVRLLLLDEPFAGLDGQLKERVIEALGRVQRERRLTTLLVSHGERELRALCERILPLREGRILDAGGSRDSGVFPTGTGGTGREAGR